VKPGASLARANADVEAIAHDIMGTYPPQLRNLINLSAIALPLGDQVVGKVRRIFLAVIS